jgi:hypothetical protein
MGSLWVFQTLTGWFPLSAPGFCVKMPRSGVLQGGRLTLRLASACALKGTRVVLAWDASSFPVGPTLVLGCLTLWGPLGLALGFYRARVRHLDVDFLNSESELGTTMHSRSALPPCSPCFIQVLGNAVRRLQTCGALRGTMLLGPHSFTGLQVVFKGVG